MTERERLEREIHQLSIIIESDTQALRSKVARDDDRAALERQVEIRTAERDRLRALLAYIQN